jgi:hypothetical protein
VHVAGLEGSKRHAASSQHTAKPSVVRSSVYSICTAHSTGPVHGVGYRLIPPVLIFHLVNVASG